MDKLLEIIGKVGENLNSEGLRQQVGQLGEVTAQLRQLKQEYGNYQTAGVTAVNNLVQQNESLAASFGRVTGPAARLFQNLNAIRGLRQEYGSFRGAAVMAIQSLVERSDRLPPSIQKAIGGVRALNQAFADKTGINALEVLARKLTEVKQAKGRGAEGESNEKAKQGNEIAIGGLARLGLAINGVQAAFFAAQAVAAPFYDKLIQQNVTLQEQLLSTKASLISVSDVMQGGQRITDPTAAIKAIGPEVDRAIERMRIGSLDLVGVTSNQLVPIFQNIAGQAANIGASLDEVADLTLSTAAALGTLNIPLEQQRQEISSILQGNITNDSTVARTLGITNQMVAQWKAQGTVVEELNKKLAAFRAGNALAAQTIGGVSSNIQEIVDMITMKAGAPLLDGITAQLTEIYNWLKQNQDEIGAFLRDAVSFGQTVGAGIKSIIDSLGELANSYGEILGPVFDKDAVAVIDLLWNSFAVGIKTVIKLADNPIFKGIVTVIAAAAQSVINISTAINQASGGYKDGAEAVRIYEDQTKSLQQEAEKMANDIRSGRKVDADRYRDLMLRLEGHKKALDNSGLAYQEHRDKAQDLSDTTDKYRKALGNLGPQVKLAARDLKEMLMPAEELQRRLQQSAAAANSLEVALIQQRIRGKIGDMELERGRTEIALQGAQERLELQKKYLDDLNALPKPYGSPQELKARNDEISKATEAYTSAQKDYQQKVLDAMVQAEKQAQERISRLVETADFAIKRSALIRRQALTDLASQGLINEQEKAAELAKIEADSTAQTLEVKRQEYEELKKLKAKGVVNAREFLQKERALILEIAQLEIDTVEKNIEAERGLREAALNARLEDVKNYAEREKLARQFMTESLGRELELLEKKKGLQDSLINLATTQLEIQKEMARSPQEAQRIEQQIAQTRLNGLIQAQALERQILDLKIQQQRVQLEIGAIDAASEFASAVANLEKIKADKTSTKAQVIAAELQVLATEKKLEGLQKQIGLNEELSKIERQKQASDQQSDLIKAQSAARGQNAGGLTFSRGGAGGGGGGSFVFGPGTGTGGGTGLSFSSSPVTTIPQSAQPTQATQSTQANPLPVILEKLLGEVKGIQSQIGKMSGILVSGSKGGNTYNNNSQIKVESPSFSALDFLGI